MAAVDPSSFLPLPQAQFHVLVALTEGERHGYAIMQAVEESSGGIVRMGPATRRCERARRALSRPPKNDGHPEPVAPPC